MPPQADSRHPAEAAISPFAGAAGEHVAVPGADLQTSGVRPQIKARIKPEAANHTGLGDVVATPLGVIQEGVVAIAASTKNDNLTVEHIVGARLRHFWQNWDTGGAHPTNVEMLRNGYRLPFHFRPSSEWLPKPPQESSPPRNNKKPVEETSHPKSELSKISGVLQSPISSAQAQQQVETCD